MAIADTYTFNPDLGEIMEEAFERAGVTLDNANDIRTARRSLNYISLQWQNKGINLWTVDEQSISSSTIVEGTAEYDIDINTISILDAVIRTDHGDVSLQSDLSVSRISESTYSQIVNKLTQGRPLQYWFQRKGIKGGTAAGTDQVPTITLWPVPDVSSKYTFVYWRMKRISDMGNDIGNTVQVPDRFIPALTSALALAIAKKKPSASGRVPQLELDAQKDWTDATDEDRDKSDLFILPNMSAYGTGSSN